MIKSNWSCKSKIQESDSSVKYKKLLVILPMLVLGLVAKEVSAQPKTHRLQTMFTHSDKCLDVVNDGTNNQLQMADCGNFSGQLWTIDSTSNAPSLRFRNLFTGTNKCLDVVNDGTNNQLQMADCGNFSGQIWKVNSTNQKGYVRLKTKFTGGEKCLDIVNDGTNNRLAMAQCGNFSGQFWKITKPPS